jgi:hypothetical protein
MVFIWELVVEATIIQYNNSRNHVDNGSAIGVFEVKLLKMKIQLKMLLALVVLLQMR